MFLVTACHIQQALHTYDTVLPVVLLLVYLNLDIWTQSMFKQTGENSFLAHLRSRNKMRKVLHANLRLHCIIFSIRSDQLNFCFTRQGNIICQHHRVEKMYTDQSVIKQNRKIKAALTSDAMFVSCLRNDCICSPSLTLKTFGC